MKHEKIIVKTPGKLMILGEHAVVYGYSCIVAPVEKYVKVIVNASEENSLSTPGVIDQSWVKMIIDDISKRYNYKNNFTVTIDSELTGIGLGSSSAVTVGLVKALLNLLNIKIDNNDLLGICLAYVRKRQPRASGFDVAASIYNQVILFSGRDKKVKILTPDPLPLIIGFTGSKANTPEMVDRVREFKTRNPVIVDKIFESIEELVNDGEIAIREKKWLKLGELMNKNHSLLVKLNVSTPVIEKLVNAARQAGAYGAKLSGAGGGDCIIALVPVDKKAQVSQAIEKKGGVIIN